MKRIFALFLAILSVSLFVFCGCSNTVEESTVSSVTSFCSDENKDTVISFSNESAYSQDASSEINNEISLNEDSESKEPDISDISESDPKKDLLKVHFIDVWQGDSTFIEFPDGTNMLIDAGLPKYGYDVIRFIQSRGCKKIDYLVMTHPHADHIGGMKDIIDMVDIGCIYMPNAVSDTGLFINLLQNIKKHNIPVIEAKAYMVIKESNDLYVSIIAPVQADKENLNNCSAVIRVEYADRSFLFMGDAEKKEEMSIEAPEKCDVLKVGHHGSNSASSSSFLSKIKPQIAVISCGKNNDYGHPHTEAIERLLKCGAEVIYRTDLQGTISLYCDGKNIFREENPKSVFANYKFALNTKSKKIHTFGGKDASTIKEENRIYTDKPLKELEELGYSLCKGCNPKD